MKSLLYISCVVIIKLTIIIHYVPIKSIILFIISFKFKKLFLLFLISIVNQERSINFDTLVTVVCKRYLPVRSC